jgi:hypothetical protein
MFKLNLFIKKISLLVLVIALLLVALPAAGAYAAGYQDASTSPAIPLSSNTHLENIWARAQTAYKRQGDRLARADEFIAKVRSLIDKASLKGWDTSVVQAALNAFASVIPTAQAAHAPGAAIIARHDGFDAVGKVTDPLAAAGTVNALDQVLRNTRSAMNGTRLALRTSIKAFRIAHHLVPATSAP